ncbi:MAG TPA: Mo-dependent nitrogenase C-terminal domain-containing protein [Nostocaceae cyanobacterium]|nr:Mo-dependent nitrogenase C-terminal domain-containing protein [Nostocaceae cyanobacterium]
MESVPHTHSHTYQAPTKYKHPGTFDLFHLLRCWLNGIQVKNQRFAHFLCQLIPCCCPFERDVLMFGRTFHIPALCKINPVYDEVVALRFRALSYLADECHEDIRKYIC